MRKLNIFNRRAEGDVQLIKGSKEDKGKKREETATRHRKKKEGKKPFSEKEILTLFGPRRSFMFFWKEMEVKSTLTDDLPF